MRARACIRACPRIHTTLREDFIQGSFCLHFATSAATVAVRLANNTVIFLFSVVMSCRSDAILLFSARR